MSEIFQQKITSLEKKVNQLENELKKLKQNKEHLKSESYIDYYFNSNYQNIIQRLSDTIEQEGTILELKAINDFKKFGYSAYEYFYTDLETSKGRQIDIVANKQSLFKVDETQTTILLNLCIVADCKYKSKIDFLCFDVGTTLNNIYNFPIFVAPDYKFRMDNIFNNLLVTSKVTQLEINANAKNGEHLSNSNLYNNCLQVYDCIKNLYKEKAEGYVNLMKDQIKGGSYLSRVIEILKQDKYINIDEIMEILSIKSVYEFLDGVKTIRLDVFIPILIFDENRGILQAEINQDFKLTNLKDIKLSLYEFSKGYKLHEDDYTEDYIFLANRNGLNKLLSHFELYIKEFEVRFRDLFERHPRTLISLFNNAANYVE